jgi:hypothetical protein
MHPEVHPRSSEEAERDVAVGIALELAARRDRGEDPRALGTVRSASLRTRCWNQPPPASNHHFIPRGRIWMYEKPPTPRPQPPNAPGCGHAGRSSGTIQSLRYAASPSQSNLPFDASTTARLSRPSMTVQEKP